MPAMLVVPEGLVARRLVGVATSSDKVGRRYAIWRIHLAFTREIALALLRAFGLRLFSL